MLLLHGCNILITTDKHDYSPPGLREEFSSARKLSQLNGLFTATGVKVMLVGKDYCVIVTVFSFTAAFIDLLAECHDNSALKKIYALYWDIVNQLLYSKAMFGARKKAVSVNWMKQFDCWKRYQRFGFVILKIMISSYSSFICSIRFMKTLPNLEPLLGWMHPPFSISITP